MKSDQEKKEDFCKSMLQFHTDLAREAYGDDVVVVLSEGKPGEYADNPTIKEYKAKGYEFFDANIFGMGLDQTGEVLFFRKPAL